MQTSGLSHRYREVWGSLVFFCEFDLEKFVTEHHNFDKQQEVYLKSMNPNLELNAKIEEVRIKEKRKAARYRQSGVYTESEGSQMARTANSHSSQLARGGSFIEELGPAENYVHLFDQDLKDGNVSFLSDKTKRLIMELDTIGELGNVLEECRALISRNANEINEEYLEKLLLDVKRLYNLIEKGDNEGSRSSLEALNKIQANIYIKKKQLENQKEQAQQEQKAKEMASLLAIEMSLNKGVTSPSDKLSDPLKLQGDKNTLPQQSQPNLHNKASDGDLGGINMLDESAGKDLSDVNVNRTKGTIDDLRKLDLTHAESAKEVDSQKSQTGMLEDELFRAKSMRTTPGALSPGSSPSPKSRNTIRFLSKENVGQLELYMKVLREGESLSRQESPRTKTLLQLQEVRETIEQSEVQIKELEVIRKELQQVKLNEKKKLTTFKVVDKTGKILEVQRLDELEQRWTIIRKETGDDSECSDDETIIYEEFNQTKIRFRGRMSE